MILRKSISVESNIDSMEMADVILVLANAVVDSKLLMIENDRVRLRKVEIGIRGTGFVEITSGASGGEMIVSPATNNIKNGSRARPVLVEPGGP